MQAFLYKNGIVLSILAALALAALFPGPGSTGGWLVPEITTKIAVMIIFLLQGFSLPSEALLRSILNWKLHAGIQLLIFVFFPLIFTPFLLLAEGVLTPDIFMGLIFLIILPTTVASAIAYTVAANGDAPTALFNTALSNILAVFIVPAWCLFMLGSGGFQRPPLLPILATISLLILLPFFVGQVLRPWLKQFADRHKALFRRCNNGLIAFVIYAAFSQSVTDSIWSDHSLALLAEAFAAVFVILIVAKLLIWKLSGKVRISHEQRIAVFYVSSQKSLATGVPLATSIFAAVSEIHLGLLLLPLIVYHVSQLLVGSIIMPGLAQANPGIDS
jgi:solute carrier family 10 (sodium/bile acid cotransporter), member 7